jgi:hypothetical protein
MAGTDSDAPFRRIEELEQENEDLRELLEQADEEIDRLRRDNEQLRKELKAAGRGSKGGRRAKAALAFGKLPPGEGLGMSHRSQCR